MDVFMRISFVAIIGLLAFAILAHTPARAQSTYTEPAAYCRAVGTIDAPDRRYRGPKVPASIKRALYPANPDINQPYVSVSWRCQQGAVLACVNSGETGPCDKKDQSKVASQPMRQFCRENPSAPDIPAPATGHWTVYAWGCRQARPYVVRQFLFPDARGFASDEWTRVLVSRR
jgi:hypothetical protein